MPTMSLAKQILALWILLPPVFAVSLLLAICAPLFLRDKVPGSAAVKPTGNRIPVAAKNSDLAYGMGGRHPEHV